MPPAFDNAYGSPAQQPLGADQQHSKEHDKAWAAMDFRLMQDLHFSMVTGRRHAAAQAFLQDRSQNLRLILLAIAIEPLRYITAFLLGAARDVVREDEHTELLDMLVPAWSPVYLSLQYIASVLLNQGGAEKRVVLAWRFQRCRSLSEWVATKPVEARLLRRILLLVSAWLFRRHIVPLSEPPWSLCVVSSTKATPTQKMKACESFDSLNSCCLRAGLARSLKDRGVTGPALLTEKWRRILYTLSAVADLQIADVEVRHARNRKFANAFGRTGWPQFVAAYVNREAHALHRARCGETRRAGRHTAERGQQPALQDRPPQAQQPPPLELDGALAVRSKADRRARPYLRAQSALDLFRYDFYARNKAMGGREQVHSNNLWGRIREEFDSLPCERRRFYETWAHESVLTAKQARARKKALAAQRGEVVALHGTTQNGDSIALPPPDEQNPHEAPFLVDGTLIRRARNTGFLSASSYALSAEGDFSPEELCKLLATSQKQIAHRDGDVVDAPISGETLSDHFQLMRSRGITQEALYQAFVAESQRMAGPAGGNDAFPQNVTYPTQCGVVCLQKVGEEYFNMHRQVLSNLLDFVASFGKPSQVHAKDIIFVGESYRKVVGEEGEVVDLLFASINAGSARSGRVAPTATFSLWERSGDSAVADPRPAYHEVQLTLATKEFTPPERRLASPLGRQACGPIVHLIEGELCDMLAKPIVDGAGRRELAAAHRIVVRALRYRDVDLGKVVIDSAEEEHGVAELVGQKRRVAGGES